MNNKFFDGTNIVPNLPNEMVKVVNFLNERVTKGDFVFGNTFAEWEERENVIKLLHLGYREDQYYYAIALAYITAKNDGKIEMPANCVPWKWACSLNMLAGFVGWKPSWMANVINALRGKEDDIDGLLRSSAQTYARENFESGLELKMALQEYTVSISAGLMEKDFHRYCVIFPPAQDRELFLEAYCLTHQLDASTIERAFDIVMTFDSCITATAMAFLMKEQRLLQGERKARCEKRIVELMEKGETAPYVTPFCNWAIYNDEEKVFVEEVALLLIEGLGADHVETLGAIDKAVAQRGKGPEHLVNVLLKVADVFNPTEVIRMTHCLHRLNEKRESFVELAVSFIIHHNGEYRLVGRRLWDEYHLESSEFDITSSHETVQCAFAYSMLQDKGNPETRLPKVLPLIKSKNKRVKDFVITILRPYTDDYMGHVVSALDKLQIKGNEAKKIKEYVDCRGRFIKNRREVKELSPAYTYDRVYREARRVESEHLQSKMREAEENHHSVWKEIAAKVVLARGGGWRREDGSTQKLPLIQFSMPARLLTESLSPREQNEWINELLMDWNDTSGNH